MWGCLGGKFCIFCFLALWWLHLCRFLIIAGVEVGETDIVGEVASISFGLLSEEGRRGGSREEEAVDGRVVCPLFSVCCSSGLIWWMGILFSSRNFWCSSLMVWIGAAS